MENKKEILFFIVRGPFAHHLIEGIGKMVGVGKAQFSCHLGNCHGFLP